MKARGRVGGKYFREGVTTYDEVKWELKEHAQEYTGVRRSTQEYAGVRRSTQEKSKQE